jgi:hypothetical protein
VPLAELKEVAQAFFRPERLAVAVVSPVRRPRPLDRWLNF